MAFPTTGILDNFNRSDEGPPPSASWVNSRANGLKVASNVCVCEVDVAGDASSWNSSFAADQECYAKLTAPGSITLYARLQTANSWASDQYQLFCSSTTVMQIWKQVSTVFTKLGADISITHVDGDQYGIELIGTTIKAYQNGTEIASRTDSDISGAGFIGASISPFGSNMDDFGGGVVVITSSGATKLFTRMDSYNLLS